MTTFTGKGIDVFRLTTAKVIVKAESEGLRMMRGWMHRDSLTVTEGGAS